MHKAVCNNPLIPAKVGIQRWVSAFAVTSGRRDEK
jgi:hypothetical protein